MKIISVLIFILNFSSVSFSVTTLSSVTGASNTIISSTDGSWQVFGGIQGPNYAAYCTGGVTGPCNTCTGANGVDDGACNPAGVFADTPLTFSGTSDVATVGAKWNLCTTGGAEVVTPSANKDTMLTTTWGEICSELNSGDSDCSDALSTSTLYLGVGTDCSNLGTEKISIKFLSRAVDPTVQSNYVDCPSTPSGQYGACHFSLFPGDSKVYLEDSTFSVNTSFPAVDGGPSGITTNQIFFFFVEVGPTEADNDAYLRITNDSANSISTSFLPVANDSSLGGSFIDDLTNDVRYCFRMASQDTAKNIEYFTPLSVCAADPCDDVCMTPSEVVGILSDKKCFIATAAFGSEMDQHVQMLRKFRNEFMAPYWLGRKIVKAYYYVSPTLAKWISENDQAKKWARWMLWPILGWAELALKLGGFILLAPFVVLISCFFIFRLFQTWRFRKA